jgi:AmpE protein
MTFIIVLLALVLERFFHWHHLRHWRWYMNYERWLNMRVGHWSAPLVLVAGVLPPVLIIGLLQHLLAGWWWGIFEFILGIIVLLYCLGPDNLWAQAYDGINKLNTQDAGAIGQVQTAFGMAAADNSQMFHQAFVRAIFIAAHQRIFAVLFWFAILGPVGAVFYRLIEGMSSELKPGNKIAAQIKNVLDWPSSRLFTFFFALGGHFSAVFNYWKREAPKGLNNHAQLIGESGMLALDILENNQLPETGAAEREALTLIDRVFVIGLVILAMVVLLS